MSFFESSASKNKSWLMIKSAVISSTWSNKAIHKHTIKYCLTLFSCIPFCALFYFYFVILGHPSSEWTHFNKSKFSQKQQSTKQYFFSNFTLSYQFPRLLSLSLSHVCSFLCYYERPLEWTHMNKFANFH